MEDVWLINKIDCFTPNSKILPITFAIENIGSSEVQEKVFRIVTQTSCCEGKDITMKYYGISIEMEKKCIPTLIHKFSEHGIKLYGVFSSYSDD